MGRHCSGAPDRHKRKRDRDRMLSPKTPWKERRALLNEYGVNLFLVSPSIYGASGWTRGHVRAHWKQAGYALLSLSTQ